MVNCDENMPIWDWKHNTEVKALVLQVAALRLILGTMVDHKTPSGVTN